MWKSEKGYHLVMFISLQLSNGWIFFINLYKQRNKFFADELFSQQTVKDFTEIKPNNNG